MLILKTQPLLVAVQVEQVSEDNQDRAATEHVLTTRFVDDVLLSATDLHHDTRGDYNQVVLVGDVLDTRPFRLPWQTGTVIYLLGPSTLHAVADAKLKAQKARVPRGCLLCRVGVEVAPLHGGGDGEGEAFSTELLKIGFRGDRPSAWALQARFVVTPF